MLLEQLFSYFVQNIIQQQKLVLLLIIETLQPWIYTRKGIFEYFYKYFVPQDI